MATGAESGGSIGGADRQSDFSTPCQQHLGPAATTRQTREGGGAEVRRGRPQSRQEPWTSTPIRAMSGQLYAYIGDSRLLLSCSCSISRRSAPLGPSRPSPSLPPVAPAPAPSWPTLPSATVECHRITSDGRATLPRHRQRKVTAVCEAAVQGLFHRRHLRSHDPAPPHETWRECKPLNHAS